jgi:cytochrome c biogenesis protein CcdA
VLTLAATSGSALHGAALLVAYSLGLGVWFLAFGVAFSWIAPGLAKVRRFLPALLGVSGGLFILVGAAMFLGEFGRLNSYFRAVGFLFDGTYEAESELVSGTGGALGPLIAAFGGVVSFLSPCVLPLVPVYLANLAGEASLGPAGYRHRRPLVLHAAAFVLGFTLVFALLGASAGFAGNALLRYLDTVTRAGGLLLIAMGLQLSGLVHFPYLERTYQLPAPAPSARR